MDLRKNTTGTWAVEPSWLVSSETWCTFFFFLLGITCGRKSTEMSPVSRTRSVLGHDGCNRKTASPSWPAAARHVDKLVALGYGSI